VTIRELIDKLEQYDDDLEVFVQGDTIRDPSAAPQNFVVEIWDKPETDPPMVLLAGLPFRNI
jgi:hypothetical protein